MLDDLGDAEETSENTAWIYDTDFEFLNDDSITQIICSGVRRTDYKVRLLLAGVPEEKLLVLKKSPMRQMKLTLTKQIQFSSFMMFTQHLTPQFQKYNQ